MAETVKSVEQKVPCEVCLKEVPVSAAKSAEADDYVAYFCGMECYVKWKEDAARGDEGGKGA